jgi:DNA-binding transcriptional LysR family regulator
VLDAGTVSEAAARMHTAQPALSRRMARIEHELGGRLFERLPRRVVPTALGQLIAEAAVRLENERRRVLDNARTLVLGTTGTVRVSSLAGGVSLLAHGLARFQAEHPEVWVELRVLGAAPAVLALRGLDVDLATLPGKAVPADIEHQKLAQWRVVLAVKPDHPFAKSRRVALAELAREPLLMLTDEFIVSRYVRTLAERRGVALRARLDGGSPDAVISLARHGLGVGVLPDSVRLPRGLVGVALADQPKARESDYVVAWLGSTPPSEAARALVQTLVTETRVFRSS